MRTWARRHGVLLRTEAGGQGLAEFALVIPLALMLIFGIISLGLWVFYQQQVTNVAREAARYAAIHSSTAICPTASWRDPNAPPATYPLSPYHCDGPAQVWPNMTSHARNSVWGTNPALVNVKACWSGYVRPDVTVPTDGNYSAMPIADHPPSENDAANQFVQCYIQGVNPVSDQTSLPCDTVATSASNDPASDIPDNQVTVYACMPWSPPLAGFLLIPPSVTLKAIVTEVIHRQQ
ncbi:MAG: TadE family protein [Chloroflexota bacterium]